MRPPLVKRQTTPESGFLAFFPPSGAWRSQQTVSCSDLISVHGCYLTWLHQTRIEVLSPLERRLQKSIRLMFCDLAACRRDNAMAKYKAFRLVRSRPFAQKNLVVSESILVRETFRPVWYLRTIAYTLPRPSSRVGGALIPWSREADASSCMPYTPDTMHQPRPASHAASLGESPG